MRLAAILLLPLLTSAPLAYAAPTAAQPSAVTSADAAKPKVSKAAKAKKIAGVKKLQLKLQPSPPPSMPGTRTYGKMKSLPPLEVSSIDTVKVSPQNPLHGGAFLIVNNADVVTADVDGFIERGVHLGREGAVSVVLPRAWVGDSDLLVECTGALPTKVEGAAVLLSDYGFATYGRVEVAPDDGRVRFLLMTADLGGGNWVRVQLHNADYQAGDYWRVDGCSVERI
jgi:hypothetical protein